MCVSRLTCIHGSYARLLVSFLFPTSNTDICPWIAERHLFGINHSKRLVYVLLCSLSVCLSLFLHLHNVYRWEKDVGRASFFSRFTEQKEKPSDDTFSLSVFLFTSLSPWISNWWIKMRGATSPMFPLRLPLKVYWRTGSAFEHVYSLESTTLAEVKISAVRFFKQNDLHFDQRRSSFHYKLISIASKRPVDEEKTLRDGRVDLSPDEYLLVKKTTQQDKVDRSANSECVDWLLLCKAFVHCSIDVAMIDYRTEDLPLAAMYLCHRESLSTARSEVDRCSSLRHPCRSLQISFTSIYIGFYSISSTSRWNYSGVIRMPNVSFNKLKVSRASIWVQSFREFLTDTQVQSLLAVEDHPFVSSQAIQSLTEIGFKHNQILPALRMFHNDTHRAVSLREESTRLDRSFLFSVNIYSAMKLNSNRLCSTKVSIPLRPSSEWFFKMLRSKKHSIIRRHSSVSIDSIDDSTRLSIR